MLHFQCYLLPFTICSNKLILHVHVLNFIVLKTKGHNAVLLSQMMHFKISRFSFAYSGVSDIFRFFSSLRWNQTLRNRC